MTKNEAVFSNRKKEVERVICSAVSDWREGSYKYAGHGVYANLVIAILTAPNKTEIDVRTSETQDRVRLMNVYEVVDEIQDLQDQVEALTYAPHLLAELKEEGGGK